MSDKKKDDKKKVYYSSKKCATCGKRFFRFDYVSYAYKVHVSAGEKSAYKYFCSYHCLRDAQKADTIKHKNTV